MAFISVLLQISIHAPREGGDPEQSQLLREQKKFQSTPPARGATYDYINVKTLDGDFNPRPPRGGRRCTVLHINTTSTISIHAPREGGDTLYLESQGRIILFQSTPPARGATRSNARLSELRKQFQSTPPARGATSIWPCSSKWGPYFNPRPPRGGRLNLP